MRTWLASAFMVLALLSVAPVAMAQDPQEEARRTLEDLQDQIGVEVNVLEGDESASGEGTSDGPKSSGGSGSLLAFADAVTVPVTLIANGLVDLGMGILHGLFAGVGEGAATLGDATQVIAAHPVRSAALAGLGLTLIGYVGLSSFLLPRYGSIGAIPLFSRIAKSELLDNKVRNDIFELIRANPGINVSEISRRLDIAWGTTTHHLQKLRAEKLVAIRTVARQKCFFTNGGSFTPHEMDVMSATKQDTAHKIAEYVASHGPTPHHRIVHELGLSPALVSYHLSKLSRAGVVQAERQGRSTIFTSIETNLRPTPRPMAHGI